VPSDLPSVPADPSAPRSLDRAAVERVLARAAELQAAQPGESGLALSEADLLEAAREAGLSPDAVRQALVEERLRGTGTGAALARAAVAAPDDGTVAGRVAGPGVAAAARIVPGTPTAVLAALARVLERDECMTTVRRLADRAAWEPRRDLVGNLLRGLRTSGGTQALRAVAGVAAAVLPVDGERVLVRVEADLSARRRQRLAVGGVTAGTGAMAAGTVTAIGLATNVFVGVLVPIAIIPAVAGGAAAWALARGHRADVARAAAALEALLDRVEHPAPAPEPALGGLREMLDGVRRALR
jgi:hypothetical protein